MTDLVQLSNQIARTTGHPTANFQSVDEVPAAILSAAREEYSRYFIPIARHDCGLIPDESYSLHGRCITHIEQIQTGDWYAHNDEYATQIFYCPFCGAHL